MQAEAPLKDRTQLVRGSAPSVPSYRRGGKRRERGLPAADIDRERDQFSPWMTL